MLLYWFVPKSGHSVAAGCCTKKFTYTPTAFVLSRSNASKIFLAMWANMVSSFNTSEQSSFVTKISPSAPSAAQNMLPSAADASVSCFGSEHQLLLARAPCRRAIEDLCLPFEVP